MAKNYGFIIDNRRCIGCHACTVACKSEHSVPVGVNRTWVKYVEKGTFPNSRRLFSVMRCNHCDAAPCVEICPVTALYRRPDGIVDFDNRRCIGCKACMQACPYDALYIDPQTHTAAKCNYCAHRIDVGLEPACVVVCPTQAIVSGDLNDPESKISRLKSRQQVTARKVEKGTFPAVYYIDGDTASLDPLATEPIAESLWSQQNRGVGFEAPELVSDGRHPLDRLGDWLSLGETSATFAKQVDANRQNLAGTPRRVYDAPRKGIPWGWQVTAYLWTKGIAAGVAMWVALGGLSGSLAGEFGLRAWGAAISLIFLALTGLLLTTDLEQPQRFLYVLLRPQWRSWLVRGAYIITFFGAIVTAYWLILAWGGAAFAVEGLVLAGGAATAAYTAFLFAQAKGRDYWQSPLLPVQMLAHSLLLGAGASAVGNGFTGIIYGETAAAPRWFVLSALGTAAGLHLLCELSDMLLTHGSTAAGRAAKEIVWGRYARQYWWGSFLLGGIIPLLMSWVGTTWSLPVGGLAALVGIYVSQHILVYAPQQVAQS